jgi:hypothetical protein
MKRTVIILILVISAMNTYAQDSLFKRMTNQSECIINATVLEIGRKIRFEDGVVNYTITCVVNESFKGTCKVKDTVRIQIMEYTLNSAGRGDSLSAKEAEKFIYKGASFVFLLKKAKSQSRSVQIEYKPLDSLLGILIPNEQLLFYLRLNYQTH